MSDVPPIPEGVLEDLAIILTPQERQAIMDARLIVWMVQHGQTTEAVALADVKSPAHFFDTLDGLADRLDNAERVGRRKMRDWLDEVRGTQADDPLFRRPKMVWDDSRAAGLIGRVACRLFGHRWERYDHWEFDLVGGGYVCTRCHIGRPWREVERAR